MGFFAFLSIMMTPLALREKRAPQSLKAIVLANLAFGVQAVLLNFSDWRDLMLRPYSPLGACL